MAQESKSPAKGKIGLFGAMAIGIGGMVGGGIFAVLGEAVSLAHGATAVAFMVAGVVAYLTSYSYSRLSVRYPSAGGTVVFIDQAFGTNLVTGTLNLMLWLSYLVTISLYAVAFGSYGLTFFSGEQGPWLRHLLISIAILLPVLINLFNAEIVGKSETFIVALKLILLAVVMAAGVGYVDPKRFSPSEWGSPLTFVAAGFVIFVAYEGFELIANSAADVKNPAKTLPRAYNGSVLLVIGLYLLVALVTVGTVPEDRIAEVKDYALAEAARPALGQVGFVVVAIAALLATFSAINASLYGNARLGFVLAKDGELPRVLKRKAWNQPVWGVLVVAGLSLLMANLVDLTSIAIIGSAGFLLIFAAANAAGVKLAKETGGNRWVSLAGCLACLASLCTLLVHTAKDNIQALWVFASFIAFSAVFELTYGRLRRGPLRLIRGHDTKLPSGGKPK